MQVDGRALAAQIQEQLAATVASKAPHTPRLGIVACAPDAVTQQYLRLKQAKAEAIGIQVQQIILPATSDTSAVQDAVRTLAAETDGVVVQLPLPPTIDTAAVLEVIPAAADVDALRGSASGFVSPVARAIEVILQAHDILIEKRRVLVFGAGALVGRPVADWFAAKGAMVTIVTAEDVVDMATIQAADIIVLGAGHPGLLTPEMITAETVVLDAGTSEASGRVRGDADPACAKKAALFTPVPGGIGPITVVTLLDNVIRAAVAE